MALNAAKAPMGSGPRQETIPVGTYQARLVQVIDLGLQPQQFQGQQKEPKHEVNLTYELCGIYVKDENGKPDTTKPRWVGESFPLNNLKADKAKSTKRINAIDPEGKCKGDLVKMLGMPCLVTIAHNVAKKNNNVYANVALIAPPMAGMATPELKNEPKWFDLSEPNLETFLSLPEFIQEKIKNNLEFPGSKLDRLINGNAAAADRAAQDAGHSLEEMDEPPF